MVGKLIFCIYGKRPARRGICDPRRFCLGYAAADWIQSSPIVDSGTKASVARDSSSVAALVAGHGLHYRSLHDKIFFEWRTYAGSRWRTRLATPHLWARFYCTPGLLRPV